jgi:hypothetical protein
VTEEFGTEAERPDDAARDYPALLDRLSELAYTEDVRDALRVMVELGEAARKALDHWGEG